MKRVYKLLMLSLLIAFAGVSAIAQVTTSSMSGRVVDAEGPVIGATVVAIHTPSGTKYGAVTNLDGRYNLNAMRVGGPYTVTVTYIGYADNVTEGITLSLGQPFVLDVNMQEESTALSEVTVIGTRSKLNIEKTGASTNINNSAITSMPTIGRSVGDIAKLSPYASGMSIAGGDSRSTNFTVDGANFNNNFGLSGGLPGGGNPISLDAIEEIQVVVSPFDVRQTNFIGGGINAITKSGTNTFRGSAYTYLYNQDMRGNRIGDIDFGERPKEEKNIYGMTFGGPIVKNKLFFFVNAEYEKRPEQVVKWRPSQDGVANLDQSISRTKASDMDLVKKHLMDNYGYDAGSYTDFPGDQNNIKLLGRIDWNITDNHKLSFRYNYTKNRRWVPTNGNSTDAGYRNRNMNRISEYGMAFSNSLYSMDNLVHGFSLDLNSRFGNNMSNQFLATYTIIKDMRESNSEPFPFIDILVGRDNNNVPVVEPYITAGYELFTWNNGVNNNKWSIIDNFTYYLDQHKITAGLSYEYQMANNAYMRNGTGYYRYASLDEFLNQAAPIDVSVTYGYDGEKNPAAEVAFHSIGAYVQDEYDITENFKLTYGLRADYLKYVDNLIRNNAIYELDFGGRKIDTGIWPDARVQFSPRAGFTWNLTDDKSLVLRGGTGIFQGRLPLVFFTNMPTNSGMVQGSGGAVTTYKGGVAKSDSRLAEFAGKMITDPVEMAKKLGLPMSITPEDGALPRDINAVDPQFRMPQVWKSSLALDYQLPVSFPFTVTVEGIFTKTLNGVMLKNYGLKYPDNTWATFEGPDNRWIYPGFNDRYHSGAKDKNAYVLSNTDEGWGAIANITLKSEPIRNLNLMASYTFTKSMEVSGMPGSNARSAYTGLVAVNGPHLPQLEMSEYVVPHRVTASASYTVDYNDHVSQSISLFYNAAPAGTYSYVYSNDLNGDGIGTDLIYIPAQRGDIKFATQADEDRFFAFMEQDKYLSNHKGQYAGANAVLAPWLHRIDLRLAQDFKLKVGESINTLQVSLDILNFGNLINTKWGVPQNMSKANYGAILQVDRIDGKTPVFKSPTDKKGNVIPLEQSFTPINHYGNTWSMQLGVRYTFN